MNRFVYFDLGNVLVSFDHQTAVRQLAQAAKRSENLVRAVVFDSNLQNRYETGAICSDDFVLQINRELETHLPREEVLEATSAIFSPNNEILSTLAKLKTLGVPMGILSNTCEAHWEWLLLRDWPVLGDWFTTHVLSYRVRSVKPESRIYEVCEVRSRCVGSSIFFTDDREENIAGAQRRGWSAHHYRSIEALVISLERWLAS